MTKSENSALSMAWPFGHLSFDIVSSFELRHSSHVCLN